MALHRLPNELFLRIAWFLLKCETCHCHHVSHHLSALAGCSPRLLSLLTPELLPTASALNILLWAIGHSRQDTVTLAINHGADANLPLCETHCFNRMPHHVLLGTPLHVAFRMRMRSIDPASHQLKLDVCTTLLSAGGKLTIETLSNVADSGDVDLLRCSLPYIRDINAHDQHDGRTLLELAGSNGHVGIVALLLAAGATVNSTGPPNSPNYFPPLWILCDAPLPVLHLLLDAGADATWEHDGESIVEHLLQNHVSSRDIEATAELLARHGARVPKREEAISLWQAPVWESWTTGGALEFQLPTDVVRRARRTDADVHMEYDGWMVVAAESWDEWGPISRRPGLDQGCGCSVCPLHTTGGYRAVRELVDGEVPVWRYDVLAPRRVV